MPLQKKNSWQSAPFLRLLIPWVAGILLAYYVPVSTRWIQWMGGLSVLILLCFTAIPVAEKFSRRYLGGIAIHLLMASLGARCCQLNQIEKDPSWIGHHYQRGDTILLQMEEPVVQKPKTFKTLVRLMAIRQKGQWIPTRGFAFLYFRDPQMAMAWNVGDRLLIHQNMQRIGEGKNSGNVDQEGYRKYCALHRIHFQIFLKGKADSLILHSSPYNWRAGLFRCRNTLLQILKKYIPDPKAHAVAEALLIGYKDDLNRSLLQSYSNTGVIHIIAISGMHLAMIYGLLLMLLKPFGHKRWHQYMRAFIILSILWLFGFLTGGAAAILRSALGFTFILISNALGFRNNTFNALAASAFLLLVYDPLLVFDLGFLLSYAAVLGIILFSKPILAWLNPKNKLLQLIWELNAITLSAQIFTLPIILYQFHRFPNLFLFTNLIVVPLSGLILYAEIAILLFSPMTLLAKPLGNCTTWLIRQMNELIERTDRIPFAVTEGIQINLLQTLLLFAVIISLLQWWMHQRKKGLIVALCLLLLIISIRTFSILL